MEGGGEAGDAILGDEMSNKSIDERCGFDNGADEYVERMSKLTGEYIDQFTTVKDTRTTDKILSRVPKCCRKPDEPSPTKCDD